MNVLDTEKEQEKEKAKQTLKSLIEEQEVKPVEDLNKLSDLWVVDDDPDSLMNFILEERTAKKELNK